MRSCRLPPEVRRLADVVRSCSDFPVHLVGGGVRDMLLGRPPKDLDFLVFGPIDPLARKVANRLGRQAIRLGEAQKLLWRVVGEDLEMDFTPPRDSTLEGDLKNRDFSVNALAWSLDDDRIVDPVGGVADLRERCIRMTHPLVFEQDPVRLMRAFRLAAHLDFRLEPETLEQMASDKNLIRGAASERVGMEFLELLRARMSAFHVRAMHRIGILEEALLGEADAEAGGRFSEASLAALERLDAFVEDVGRIFPSHAGEVRRWLAESRNAPVLKLTLLLSDLEKGAPLEANLRAEAAASVAKRLALSNKEARLLADLQKGLSTESCILSDCFNISAKLNERGMLRFLRGAGAWIGGLLLLALAVIASTGAPGGLDCSLDLSRQILTLYYKTYLPRLGEPRLLTGEDLKARGLSPGPLYKEILEAVETARMEGDITDRSGALAWLDQRIAHERCANSTKGRLN